MTTRRLWLSCALALLVALGAVPGTSDADPPVVDKWSLWSAGTTKLRGANIYQRRVYPEIDGTEFLGSGPVGPPYTLADFQALAALGANYVNISHPGLFAEKPDINGDYVLDPAIKANLDTLLDLIRQANMYAVISFRTGPGRSEFTFFASAVGAFFDATYLNDTVWASNQAGADARLGWAAMWAATASAYMANPVVVGYDLMVEPNSNDVGSNAITDPLSIFDPAVFYGPGGNEGTSYDWNQLYPAITSAIRGVDTATPILVGAMSYSAVTWLPYLRRPGMPAADPKTVYTVHQYEPFLFTHQVKKSGKCPKYLKTCDTDFDGVKDAVLDRDWLDGQLAPVDAFRANPGFPVAVNEFGVARWKKGAADFMRDQMELFEERGLNHALWVWASSHAPFVKVDHEFNFRLGPKKGNRKQDVLTSDLIEAITDAWAANNPAPPDP